MKKIDYHSDYSHVNCSMLKVFCESPSEYYQRYILGKLPEPKRSEAMDVGTIVHALVLERQPIEELIAIYPPECMTKAGSLNYRAVAAFDASVAPRIAVKSAVADQIGNIFAALVSSRFWELAEMGECEQVHRGVIYGVPSKCMPDCYAQQSIWDLKVSSPVPHRWLASARRFNYWLQDAHYSAVMEYATGKPIEQFQFVVVEPTPPHRVQFYHYGQRSRELAREYHARKMTELYRATAENDWQDHWPEEMRLSDWEVAYEDVELVGFEDE